tara:strand:+ start:6833 stop:7024 length:192 start_codon:yes stop_codon:yes gene_type:complete
MSPVKVGDLVYVVSSKQIKPLPNQTKGVVFSQIDEDWFRIYITWDEHAKVQDFPRHMLTKVVQ